jgi:hypothetical protein
VQLVALCATRCTSALGDTLFAAFCRVGSTDASAATPSPDPLPFFHEDELSDEELVDKPDYYEGDEAADKPGYEGEDKPEKPKCSADDLKAGVRVREAKLKLTSDGLVFKAIKLLR